MKAPKYLYDPFTPVFQPLVDTPQGQTYEFEVRLKAPVRRVKIYSHEVWLPKGIGFNPSTKELCAKKNRNRKQIFYEKGLVHPSTSKTDVAKLVIRLVNALFSFNDSLPMTDHSMTVNYSVCIKTPKKPTHSPTLSIVTNITGQKSTHRDVALSSLKGVDDAIQLVSWTNSQLEDYTQSLGTGASSPFVYDRAKESATNIRPSNIAIYTEQLVIAFKRYAENVNLKVEERSGPDDDSWGVLAPFIDAINESIAQARHSNSDDMNSVDPAERFHSQPHKTSGVVGVIVSLARRELNLVVSGVTGKTVSGSFKVKRFTLTKYPLREAFELAKKSYLDAFGLPHPTTYQMNLEYDYFRASLVRTLPSELLYQTGGALEGLQVVKLSKPVKTIALSKDEKIKLKVKRLKSEGKQSKINKKAKKIIRVNAESPVMGNVAVDVAPTSTAENNGESRNNKMRVVEGSKANSEEMMEEAERLIKERLLLKSKHANALDVLRDCEFGFDNFGDVSPIEDIQIANCDSCSSPATVKEEKGMFRCHCTKCSKKGALLPSLWRASLDWNLGNLLSIKVIDIPHFHLHGRSIETSYLYLENIEPLIVAQDELCQVETELALMQRKYKLQLGTRYQKPGKAFKAGIEAYRYWFNIAFEVVKRYRLVGRAWDK